MENISETKQFKEITTLLYGLEVFGGKMIEQIGHVASNCQQEQDISGIDLLYANFDFYHLLLRKITDYPVFQEYMSQDVGKKV